MHPKHAPKSRVVALVATAIASCVSMWLGVALLPGFAGVRGEPLVSPIWPATGINVAMLWLCGLRVWPGLLIGSLIGNMIIFDDPRAIAAYTPGQVLEAVVVVAIMRRLTREPALHLLTRRAALCLITAGVLGPITSVLLTEAILELLGVASTSSARGVDWRFLFTWFIADGLSAIVITPVVVSALEHRRIPWTQRPLLYGLCIALGLFVTSAWLFHEAIVVSWLRPEPLLFITLPLIAWAALSFGVLGASISMLGLAFLSITGTIFGRGPFADLGAVEGVLLLQIYLAVAAVMSLLLGASTSARADAFRASQAHASHVTKLLNELDHRVRNNMATLLGLAQLASISSSSSRPLAPAEPAPAAPGPARPPLDIFEDRVRAMARVHTLLSSSRWSAAKLSHIVAGIVAPEAPQSPDRLRVSGDDPALEPEACQPLSLTLHELAANARVHGAWSSSAAAQGFVEIRATRTDTSQVITWIEHGAPPSSSQQSPKDPPDQIGFTGGLALVRGFVTHELGGQLEFRYRDSGIVVVITLPRDRPGLFAH